MPVGNISEGDKSPSIQFEIYRIVENQISAGKVMTYSIKNGVDSNGFELSGEVGTLSINGRVNKVAMNITNDSLGSRVLEIEQMKCQEF